MSASESAVKVTLSMTLPTAAARAQSARHGRAGRVSAHATIDLHERAQCGLRAGAHADALKQLLGFLRSGDGNSRETVLWAGERSSWGRRRCATPCARK